MGSLLIGFCVLVPPDLLMLSIFLEWLLLVTSGLIVLIPAISS